jgi:hypothetical protein
VGTAIVLVAENGDALLVKVDPWTGGALIDEPPREPVDALPETELELEFEIEEPAP